VGVRERYRQGWEVVDETAVDETTAAMSMIKTRGHVDDKNLAVDEPTADEPNVSMKVGWI
jgi:hypothetical protein